MATAPESASPGGVCSQASLASDGGIHALKSVCVYNSVDCLGPFHLDVIVNDGPAENNARKEKDTEIVKCLWGKGMQGLRGPDGSAPIKYKRLRVEAVAH